MTNELHQECQRLFAENPNLIETVEGIARRLGRHPDELGVVLDALVARGDLSVMTAKYGRVYRRTGQSTASGIPSEGGLPVAWRKQLSAREWEVLDLMMQGLGNKDIASGLFISEHTVKNHVTNILRKFGMKDRNQLFALMVHEQRRR